MMMIMMLMFDKTRGVRNDYYYYNGDDDDSRWGTDLCVVGRWCGCLYVWVE